MKNIDHCRYIIFSMCWISLSISSIAILKVSNSIQQQMPMNCWNNNAWISSSRSVLRPATFNSLVLSQPDVTPITMSMKVVSMRPLLSNSYYYFSRAINFGELILSIDTLSLLSVIPSCLSGSSIVNGFLKPL